MKPFTMNPPAKSMPAEREGALALDEFGRLYSPHIRAMFDQALGAELSQLECFAALRIASKGLHRLMERFSERHGLSEGRLGLMFWLRRQGEVSLSDVAGGLTVSPRNVTGLVDNLERDGLVERVPDQTDRRSVHARLTPKGRELIDSIWQEAQAQQTPLLDGFTPEDLGVFRHLLLRVVENIRREESK